jgi:tripartite-type tricarboxylate transporter receptor subunit TctC
MDVLPDAPPISDFVPGYLATGWTGIGAPANTSSEVIEILNREVNAALADPTFKARLAEFGFEPFANSPAELSKFIVHYAKAHSASSG